MKILYNFLRFLFFVEFRILLVFEGFFICSEYIFVEKVYEDEVLKLKLVDFSLLEFGEVIESKEIFIFDEKEDEKDDINVIYLALDSN